MKISDNDSDNLFVFVGCYNSHDVPGSGGIKTLRVNSTTGKLSISNQTESQMEAGFICQSKCGRFIFAVDERKNDGRGPVGPQASVKSFHINSDDGALELINSQPAMGAFPTYVNVDGSNKWIVTASHGSFDHVQHIVKTDGGYDIVYLFDHSTICLYPINNNGFINPVSDVWTFDGHGKDPSDSPQVGRHPQASPHAHSATFDPTGSFFIVCDKSTDRIFSFSIDAERGKFNQPEIYNVALGSAPRHPIFHPTENLLFVTNEMASSVSSFRYDLQGKIELIETISTLDVHSEDNAPADVQVHPAGKIIVINNRGEDNLVSLSVDVETGRLKKRHTYKLAKSIHPGLAARSFAFSPNGEWIFVADRPANKILSLSFDTDNGEMSCVDEFELSQPAFVMSTTL